MSPESLHSGGSFIRPHSTAVQGPDHGLLWPAGDGDLAALYRLAVSLRSYAGGISPGGCAVACFGIFRCLPRGVWRCGALMICIWVCVGVGRQSGASWQHGRSSFRLSSCGFCGGGFFFFFLSVPEDGSLSFSLGSTAGWSPDARRVSWDGPASAQAEREFAYLGGFGKLVVAVEYPFCFLPLDARVLLSCSAWLESFLVIGLISFYPLAVARACIRYAAWQQYY